MVILRSLSRLVTQTNIITLSRDVWWQELLASRRMFHSTVHTTRANGRCHGTRFHEGMVQRSKIAASGNDPGNNARRKDKQAGARNKRDASSNSPTSAAPRITGKVGSLSVHAQIKLVDRYRSLSQSSANSCSVKSLKTGSPERTAFRKSKESDYQQELRQRRKTKQEELRANMDMAGIRDTIRPTLLVDGYNICGCDEGAAAGLPLKQLFLSGDLHSAQKYLIQELDNLAIHKGYRIVCVFDADRAKTTVTDQAEVTGSGVWVVFSVRNDADSWIERASLEELNGICSIESVLQPAEHAKATNFLQPQGVQSDSKIAHQKKFGSSPQPKGCKAVVYVATNDNALRSVVQCNGAYVISASSLVEELAQARASEEDVLRKLAVSEKWEREGCVASIGSKDPVLTEKLMNLYLTAPAVNAPKFIGRGYAFSSKPRKGKKNKTSKKLPRQ